jgi:anaerobic selenocysteine-containing dehydrogenase
MRDDKLGSYFGNGEFLAALDWCPTETTRFADVVLPGSTFLESDGTRINFEGRLTRYTQAVKPPFGAPPWEILAGLAKAFDIEGIGATFAEISSEIDRRVRAGLGDRVRFYWNTGEARDGNGFARLNIADVRTKPSPIAPALTIAERYKRQVREVGVEHYRVQDQRL